MIRWESFDEHAARSRQLARGAGLHDCVHYAPDWRRRADALYEELNALGLECWDGAVLGLLEDGRMALVWRGGGFAERRSVG